MTSRSSAQAAGLISTPRASAGRQQLQRPEVHADVGAEFDA
jgi:hypothetical protein